MKKITVSFIIVVLLVCPNLMAAQGGYQGQGRIQSVPVTPPPPGRNQGIMQDIDSWFQAQKAQIIALFSRLGTNQPRVEQPSQPAQSFLGPGVKNQHKRTIKKTDFPFLLQQKPAAGEIQKPASATSDSENKQQKSPTKYKPEDILLQKTKE